MGMTSKAKTDWPRCGSLLRDESVCGRAVARDEDGGPAQACAHHLRFEVPSLGMEADVLAGAGDTSSLQPVPAETATAEAMESEPIASLRSQLRGDLSVRRVADSMSELLLQALEASRDLFCTCKKCGARTPVQVPDLATRVTAARALMEEVEGKIAAQAKTPADRSAQLFAGGVSFEDLSDDELLILLEDESEGPIDLRKAAIETARRVLAAAEAVEVAA